MRIRSEIHQGKVFHQKLTSFFKRPFLLPLNKLIKFRQDMDKL